MGMSISILIAEHQAVYRAGLRTLLEKESDFLVVGEAGNGAGVIKAKRLWETQVLLLDVALPGPPNAKELVRILRKIEKINVLAIAGDDEPQRVQHFLSLGVRGCMLKQSTEDELIQAVRIVSSGRHYIDSELVSRGVTTADAQHAGAGDADEQTMRLGAREQNVYLLLASGYTSAEASEKLGMEESAVAALRDGVMKRFGLETTADLVRYAIDNELL